MKLTVTPKEIGLKKDQDGTFSYRIKDIHVSNIPTEEEALRDAESKLMILLRRDVIKK